MVVRQRPLDATALYQTTGGQPTMRSTWKGSISFFMINIPVKVYTALESSEGVKFNQLHKGECMGPVGYRKQCKKCDATLAAEDITKGYQHEPDRYVEITPEDLASVKCESTHTISITGFIEPAEIPPTYYDASYLVAPDGKGSNGPYLLLRDVMIATGKAGLGKMVIREREETVAITASDGGLVIQKLHPAHEVRTIAQVPNLPVGKSGASELELASTLVAQMSTTFAEMDMADHYHDSVKEMLRAKIAGEPIVAGEVKASVASLDIMAALKASLGAASASKAAPEPKASVLSVVKPKPRRKAEAA